jgi:hypothetical protein
MPDITEHHSKEEREGHDREEAGIDFFVARYTIGVDDLLVCPVEIIKSEGCRRTLI